MAEAPAEHYEKLRKTAADAMALGQAAMAAGNMAEACRWLDRSRRVAGGNDAISLLHAMAALQLGDPDAEAELAVLADRHDLREAWLGLARARHRAGNAEGAAAALAEALAGHAGALPASLHAMADAIAEAVGAAGWCCLSAAHQVVASPAGVPLLLALDGVDVAALPARGLHAAHHLTVGTLRGRLLGSPFQLRRMTRLDAFVDALDGGLAGDAWHPNDPSAVPELRVIAADGASRAVSLGEAGSGSAGEGRQHDRPLASPRAFRVAADDLPGAGPFRVVGADGRDIAGSPLDPGSFARYAAAAVAAVAGRCVAAAAWQQAPVPAGYVGRDVAPRPAAAAAAVVVPVYRGRALTLACLQSVRACVPAGTRVIVVDDAGPDPELSAALDGLAAGGAIELIRHMRNTGFPGAANTGMRAAGRDDVVLLNADTLVAPGWLERLRAAAYSQPAIGTATPLSNDATLLSYPRQEGGNPVPLRADVDRMARLAHRANPGQAVEIPTAVGFCMYIRRDCLDQVGLLREDVFAQGYGEENDFCLRARHCGWRHVAATGVFVGHVGGVSFGAARQRLLARNLAVLNRLHPGYDALIAADESGPALALARRRLDLAVLAERRRRQTPGPSVVLLTHDLGGGVERQIGVRCAALRGQGINPIVVRPILARPLLQGTGACRVELEPDLVNLVYHVGTEMATLERLLAGRGVQRIEVHHMLGHDHRLMELPARLGVPYDVHLHDYAWFCPRVTLVGFERRYCGEPEIAGCEACIADAGRNIDEDISVKDLVARSARQLAAAARVVAASGDVATRFARHFPGLRAVVEPWDDSRPAPRRPLSAASAVRPRVVGVLGAIGIEKGYDILLACARDAAARRLPLRFVVLGHTTDDARLLQTGSVFITGAYEPADLPRLIQAESVELGFLPSVWPETWCFTLSEAWQAGLHVVAFDIGTPAERIRRYGGGILVPLACRAGQLNAVLLQ
jgi:GT2 family glycosyltransferase/glycosyltransferase involved in cell wall biosynthesis